MAVSEGTFARATGAVAVATAASRVTGFIRTLALAAVLGVAAVGDAYNGANTMPSMVYELLLGGVMSSVFIPVLARARLRGCAHSRLFTQRMLVATVIGAAAITLVAVAAAPLLVAAVVPEAAQSQLTTSLAYLLLPEIFFYAVAGTVTAVLNVRDSYAPAAWAPVVNNLIVLVTVGVFALLPGPVTLVPSSLTTAQVLVLGIGTTAGIVGQAAWSGAALRRCGAAVSGGVGECVLSRTRGGRSRRARSCSDGLLCTSRSANSVLRSFSELHSATAQCRPTPTPTYCFRCPTAFSGCPC
ncbi:hypothetical protein ERC79_18485 [Rhodococcus sp. ABRD24]|nr:hypothetical protein ERC79_18485 [Rhodococcus sp. ABRD24]